MLAPNCLNVLDPKVCSLLDHISLLGQLANSIDSLALRHAILGSLGINVYPSICCGVKESSRLVETSTITTSLAAMGTGSS